MQHDALDLHHTIVDTISWTSHMIALMYSVTVSTLRIIA
jgi:hypothetical protein